MAKFKFNNGAGALLCSRCNTIIRQGSELSAEEREAMKGKISLPSQYCWTCTADPQIYTLVRVSDNAHFVGLTANWIEWHPNNTFLTFHKEPVHGLSLMLDMENGGNYSYLTSPVTKITARTKDSISFDTEVASYILYKKSTL